MEFLELVKSGKLGTLKLGSAHSLIMGSVDPNTTPEELNKILPKEGSFSLGLFGGESQYNHFNPSTKPEDWTPSEGDFIYPTFRVLSEGIVTKYGIPIDFTQSNLKNTINFLQGQTVYPDHKNDEVGNSIGVVFNPFWQESYSHNGIKVPAGINAVLKIDAKANPRIARGILMDPPSIHSGSVQVNFTWEKSHQIEDREFFEKLGSYDKEGNLYRLVVKNVSAFGEYSLVTHGADPYAQQDKGGKIVNPDYAKRVNKFSEFAQFNSEDGVIIDFKTINPKNDNNMDFLLTLATAVLGQDHGFDEGTAESAITSALQLHFESQANQNANLASTIEALNGQVTQLTTERDEALARTQEVETLFNNLGGQEGISQSVQVLASKVEKQRNKVIGMYKSIQPESPSEAILNTLQNADPETLDAFEQEYSQNLEEKFPMVCQDCNSTHILRASHKVSENTPKVKVTFDERAEKFAKAKTRKPSDIHKS